MLLCFVSVSCESEIVQIENPQEVIELIVDPEEPITKSTLTNTQVDTFTIENYPYTLQEDSLYIESLGWKVDSITDCDSLYIINGDLFTYKNTLFSHRIQPSSRLCGDIIHSSTQHIYINIQSDEQGGGSTGFYKRN